jgi:predicted metal-dependent HD superfamily phosphohydrolase
MNFERLKTDVLDELLKLPEKYRYHNIEHTREVMDYAVQLGAEAGLSAHEQLLLDTAALMHDYGYLKCYHHNESHGAAAAETILPQYGYAPDDVKAVADMIRATAPCCSPRNKLESLICDADLGYLGTDKFDVRAADLRKEYMAMERELTDDEWFRMEHQFLSAFQYNSPEGRKLFGKGLAASLAKINDLLETRNEENKK